LQTVEFLAAAISPLKAVPHLGQILADETKTSFLGDTASIPIEVFSTITLTHPFAESI